MISIHKLYASGKNIREIARIKGHGIPGANICAPMESLSLVTVKREDPNWILSSLSWMNILSQGIFNSEVFKRLLIERSYACGITIIKDYVKPHRLLKQTPVVQKYETKPKYQAQVDWKICEHVDLDALVRKIPVFAMVLGYSRAMFIEFTKRSDIHSFLRCMINALETLAVSPKQC